MWPAIPLFYLPVGHKIKSCPLHGIEALFIGRQVGRPAYLPK